MLRNCYIEETFRQSKHIECQFVRNMYNNYHRKKTLLLQQRSLNCPILKLGLHSISNVWDNKHIVKIFRHSKNLLAYHLLNFVFRLVYNV
jgi:hypothetical protein